MKTFQQFLESYLEPTLSECSIEDLEDFLMSEEFEQLDEISKKTLGSYIKKSAADFGARVAASAVGGFAGKEPGKENNLKAGNRITGIRKATDRLTKEEFEQLDELSKGTLARYMSAAGRSQTRLELKRRGLEKDHEDIRRIAHNSEDDVRDALDTAARRIRNQSGKIQDKQDTRSDGIRRAMKRLSKD